MISIRKKLSVIIFSSVLSLLVIDVAIGFSVGWRYSSSRDSITRYLEYGVSTSAKLQVLISKSELTKGGIAKAGWYEHSIKELGERANPCKKIAIYGMSFSNRIAAQLRKLSPCFATRVVSGPASPISHSLYQYRLDKLGLDASHVVLGVLASSLPMLLASSHASHSYEYPGSVIYPRFRLDNKKLYSHSLPFDSFSELKESFSSVRGLQRFESYLEENDEFFNDIVFSHQWADHSIVLRFVRRAIAQRARNSVLQKAFDGEYFTNHLQLREVALAVMEQFVNEVSSAGGVPIVLLINDRGYAGALDELYMETLTTNGIRFITTSGLVDSNNAESFLADGHFTADTDKLLANELLMLLRQD